MLFGLAGAAAVANWVAVARGNKPLEYAAKPATLVLLLAAALALDPEDSAMRTWFVVALAFSLVGDVLLMLPRDLFVGGLAAFLLGHVAYVVGLAIEGPSLAGLVPGVAFVGGGLVVVGRPVLDAVRAGHRNLLLPVAAYMLVISVMVVMAWGSLEVLAIIGASLFYASDSLIAWTRFVDPVPWGPVAIMVTYHLGQAGLVLSLT